MDKYRLAEKLCVICGTIRKSGVMCELCSISDPNIDNKKCLVCCPNWNNNGKTDSKVENKV